jgi:hypothetical protein
LRGLCKLFVFFEFLYQPGTTMSVYKSNGRCMLQTIAVRLAMQVRLWCICGFGPVCQGCGCQHRYCVVEGPAWQGGVRNGRMHWFKCKCTVCIATALMHASSAPGMLVW